MIDNRKAAAEIKFLIDADKAGKIREWARSHLSPDPNASGDAGDTYQTTSLYFDTRKFDIFHRRGSFGRGKYRVRRYGESEGVFLERKLRTKEMVSKRRTIIGMQDLSKLQDSEPAADWGGYWFHRRLLARELLPVCQITYQRTARVLGEGEETIRLTLDQDIQTIPLEGLAFEPMREPTSVVEHQYILELKYRRQIPALFKQLLTQFSLSPQPVSKYRMAAVALGCAAEAVDAKQISSNGELTPLRV